MPVAHNVQKFLEAYGAVIITGASSGIGEGFLKTISTLNPKAHFFNLSRNIPAFSPDNARLEHFTADLSSEVGQDAAITAAWKWLEGKGSAGSILLINNSGFGAYGSFQELDTKQSLQMVDLNVRAPVALTAKLLPKLLERGGAVVNIASIAAFQPTPLMSVYGATKAFVLNWSLGLWQDLRETKVHALCVCPGPTSTNFFRAAGFEAPPAPDWAGQNTQQVVDESLNALARRKPLVICGWINKAQVAISSRLPHALVSVLARQNLDKFRVKSLAGQRSKNTVRQ